MSLLSFVDIPFFNGCHNESDSSMSVRISTFFEESVTLVGVSLSLYQSFSV